MGANKSAITRQKYDAIKRDINGLRKRGYSAGGIDETVIGRFGIGATTARWIRNTANYDIYKIRTRHGRGQIRYEQDRLTYKRMMARRAASQENYAANVGLLALFGIVLLAVVVSLVIVIFKVIGASR